MRYNYQEVVNIIQNTRRFGKWTGYEVSKHMLECLGNPQEGIPFVHIAGTNGKGSTTAFLCSILQQTGKKIGMFTSPHLITFRERIRINGVYISEEDVIRLGNLLLETKFDLPPTMFDYCLAMAVLYFKEQACDIMVMETGIGGRYDSTNALGTPEVAVITKIGFDHTAILGDTLEAIAGEKAGIIKKGCKVVSTFQEEEVRKVLLNNFFEVNQGIIHQEEPLEKYKSYVKEQCKENFEVVNRADFYEIAQEDLDYVKSIPMKMLGRYQIENATTAMLAGKIILEKWFGEKKIASYISKGIASAVWKGRMEFVNDSPFFLIDGAHNAHGVHALAESLKELYPNEKFHFIMGVMADKDYEEMIEELLPLAIDFVTVTPESNRALQSKDLAECIQRKGIKATYIENMEEAIRPWLPQKACHFKKEEVNSLPIEEVVSNQACVYDRQKTENSISSVKSEEERNGKTVAFGSLYFIGAIEEMMEKYLDI